MAVYTCPMHSAVRQPQPGKCPSCGMALLPEGTRFAFLRHKPEAETRAIFLNMYCVA